MNDPNLILEGLYGRLARAANAPISMRRFIIQEITHLLTYLGDINHGSKAR